MMGMQSLREEIIDNEWQGKDILTSLRKKS